MPKILEDGSLDQSSKCNPLLQLVDAEDAEDKQPYIKSYSLDQIRMPRIQLQKLAPAMRKYYSVNLRICRKNL